ncbi:MAG: UDP-N-acetylmuramoyl-L-alanyl-D-glutamate--2,6-diaminopimelate ligase [Nitrosomonas sp.]|nr:UDP-N-acetylmuramoyl-L-alanyl-D-glutamate--2,6-diaminopimelate ligase [Nitrosomonas sp.]
MSFMVMGKHKNTFDIQLLDDLGVSITRLVSDSRRVKPGDTFLAYVGKEFDARKFIPEAIKAGAIAILWEKKNFSWNPEWQLPAMPITGLKEKTGLIASHVYGHPSEKLWLVGITGTNGKTSCSHWIAQAMSILNSKTAVIGTLGNGFPGALESTINTTPDGVLLQQMIAGYLQQGADSVAIEVSSHGIVQERINGAVFSVAVLTNLSHDHLDYHGSMDAYATAKAKLFFWPGLKHAVLNLDEVYGVELSRQLENKDIQIIGYGFMQPEMSSGYADNLSIVRGSNLQSNLQGLSFDVTYQNECAHVAIDLIGRFNASNLLAVLSTLLAKGIKFADAVNAIQKVKPIVGRMEKYGGGELPVVIVDYAHTPDALEKVLVTLREVIKHSLSETSSKNDKAKLLCVIGCGGERDQAKRKLIGEIATRLADEVIITNDNPRNESPQQIIDAIVSGVHRHANFSVDADRASAIYQAIYSAKKGDVVLIAGKGHEEYQEIKGEKIPFSDAKIVQETLRELTAKGVLRS